MKKAEFVKFAIEHSDKESIENVLLSLAGTIPMIEDQLFRIYSDVEAGFVEVDEKGKLHLKQKFIKNEK